MWAAVGRGGRGWVGRACEMRRMASSVRAEVKPMDWVLPASASLRIVTYSSTM